MDGDPGLQLDDAGGDLEQAEAQGVELGMAPGRSRRQCGAQGPHQPVGAGVQEEPELIGGGAGARSPIGRQVALSRFDVVLGLAAGAVELFVDRLATATGEVGDDETSVAALWARLDAATMRSTRLHDAAAS